MFEFFARQHKLAFVFTVSLIAIGFYALFNIQKERFPNVDFEVLTIVTTLPNSSPGDVEEEITNKIEDEIKDISGIDKFTSTSKENVSVIIVTLSQDAKNIEKTKQDIKTKVIGISDFIDDVNTPNVEEFDTSKMEVLKINLAGDIEYKSLRKISNYFEEKLELVEGVSEIEVNGEIDDEIKIYLNPEKLNLYKLSLSLVIEAIRSRNYRYTAGDNNKTTDNANIVVLAKFKTIKQLENLILKSNFNGQKVRLKDVATIEKLFKEKNNILRVDSFEGFVLSVKKKSNSDVIKTVDRVKEKLIELQQKSHKNLKVFYTDDLSKDVRNRLGIVQNNGIIGFIMVLIVLGIFLSIKTAFWVATGMTATLLGTVALLLFFGETINLVSLAAIVLVLGIVVDDSIIIAESIQHQREIDNSYNGVVTGYKKVIKPVLTTIVTSILAMSSMFLMEGTMGKFIYIIPVVVIFALSLSLLEVSIGLPAHMAIGKTPKPRAWFKKVEATFLVFITRVLRFRYIVVLLFFIMAFATFVFANAYMSFNLFPTKGSDTITANIETSVNGSLLNTSNISQKVENIITQTIDNNLLFISSDIQDNKSVIKIRLTPGTEREISAQEFMQELKVKTKNIPGIEKIYFSIKRAGPPQGRDIEIQLISKDEKNRTKAANIIEQILEKTNGVSDISRDDRGGKNRLEVVFDFEEMTRLGINFSSVQSYLRAAFSGIDVITNREQGKDIDYRVFIGEEKQNTKVLSQIKIANNKGRLIDFNNFAHIKQIQGESEINHFNGVRASGIAASINDEITTSIEVLEEVLEELDLENKFPTLRLISDGGANENKKSMNSFGDAFLMSLIGIFFILMLLFNSWTQPLMVLTSVPFALIGVIWAFYLHNEALSFFTVMGALALIGVVVNDALVMTSHLNDVKNSNPTEKIINWVARGSTDRLRAVVLTSLTTLVGVMPLAYGIGGVDYLLQPMVLALGYGLLFGTIVTLILLPCLYLINHEIVNYFARLTNKTK